MLRIERGDRSALITAASTLFALLSRARLVRRQMIDLNAQGIEWAVSRVAHGLSLATSTELLNLIFGIRKRLIIDWYVVLSTFILAAMVRDEPHLKSARTLAPARVLTIPAAAVREVFRRGERKRTAAGVLKAESLPQIERIEALSEAAAGRNKKVAGRFKSLSQILQTAALPRALSLFNSEIQFGSEKSSAVLPQSVAIIGNGMFAATR